MSMSTTVGHNTCAYVPPDQELQIVIWARAHADAGLSEYARKYARLAIFMVCSYTA